MTAEEWLEHGTEGLFGEGEEVIATDSQSSYRYAIRIIKRRFKAGETAIKRDPFLKIHYEWNILEIIK